MKRLAFGALSFDRSSIPEELRDLSLWPVVDQTSLSLEDRKTYLAREKAIREFIEIPDATIRDICKASGIATSTIYRLFQRCCAKHSDGRIYGFRALIPYVRIEPYKRTHSVKAGTSKSRAGLSGAFAMLLGRHPKIAALLSREARARTKGIDSVREVRKSVKRIHKKFIELCREEGIRADEYPLNQDYMGIRSLAAHLRRLANESFEFAAYAAGAERVSTVFPALGMHKADPALSPFEVVEFDGHKIDLRLTIRVPDPFGLETLLELSRIWILVVLDLASRAVLGYTIAIGREYNKDDVAEALQAALTPHQMRPITIPGLSVRQGGGFPSLVIPATQYACWDWFRFDNARSHLAHDTLDRLTQIVGCWPDAGPAGEPNNRPFIERFFDLLARNFAHRVVGATGSNPHDIVRELADPGPKTHLLMTLDELEDLVEVLLADYNGETGPSGRTPLEVMTHMMSKRSGFLRVIPHAQRSKVCLIQEARVVTIRGNLKNGVRPHINFEHVRYSSEILSNNPGLIGKKLKIYFKPKDIRTLQTFLDDGAELGMLLAAKPWCYTPHSLRIRQEIFRLKSLGKLKYKEGDDPVEAWVRYKRKHAGQSKPAANDLAIFDKALRSALEGSYARSNIRQDARSAELVPDDPEGSNTEPVVKQLRIRKTILF